MEPVWALGLMTGTVLDGNIDIALIRTDGEEIQEFGPWTLSPYPPELGPLLRTLDGNREDLGFRWCGASDLRRGRRCTDTRAIRSRQRTFCRRTA